MAIRFEKKSDDDHSVVKKAKNEESKKSSTTIDTDTYASLQKAEKKPKKERF